MNAKGSGHAEGERPPDLDEHRDPGERIDAPLRQRVAQGPPPGGEVDRSDTEGRREAHDCGDPRAETMVDEHEGDRSDGEHA